MGSGDCDHYAGSGSQYAIAVVNIRQRNIPLSVRWSPDGINMFTIPVINLSVFVRIKGLNVLKRM